MSHPAKRNDGGSTTITTGGSTPTPPSTHQAQPGRLATVQSSHQMIEAVGIMLAFVYVMVLVAGIGRNAGRIAVMVMIVLLALQGIRNVNPFVSWAQRHPLTPQA